MSACREVAERFIRELLDTGRCERAEVSGSLRRGEPYTHDVDIVCADSSLPRLTEKIERFRQNTCDIDVYRANPVHYGAMLLAKTGPVGDSIGMRIQAKKKGYSKLNQYGLFKNDELVASETEDEICLKVLGRRCKPPEERGKR